MVDIKRLGELLHTAPLDPDEMVEFEEGLRELADLLGLEPRQCSAPTDGEEYCLGSIDNLELWLTNLGVAIYDTSSEKWL